MSRFVITGTDTGIGKTIFAAALSHAIGATYWKPVQSGLEEVDSDTVAGLSDCRILPEAYRLTAPLSPHRSAELDEIAIDSALLALPEVEGPLIVEAAGGLLVPLTRQRLYIDQMADWRLPVILCARTELGTINHSLLSIEALRARGIPIHGIAYIGAENDDNMRTIEEFSGVRTLGRLPIVEPLDRNGLTHAFQSHFNLSDFG